MTGLVPTGIRKAVETPRPLLKAQALQTSVSCRTRKPELQAEMPSVPSFPALTSHPEWLTGGHQCAEGRWSQDIIGPALQVCCYLGYSQAGPPEAISCFDALFQLSVNGFVAKSQIERQLCKRQGPATIPHSHSRPYSLHASLCSLQFPRHRSGTPFPGVTGTDADTIL